MKIIKIGCLGITGVVIASVVASLIAFSIPSLDEKALAKILKDKAGVTLDTEIEIMDFESSGPAFMHSDYAETYVVEVPPEVHSKLVADIEESADKGWENLASGYQLSINARD